MVLFYITFSGQVLRKLWKVRTEFLSDNEPRIGKLKDLFTDDAYFSVTGSRSGGVAELSGSALLRLVPSAAPASAESPSSMRTEQQQPTDCPVMPKQGSWRERVAAAMTALFSPSAGQEDYVLGLAVAAVMLLGARGSNKRRCLSLTSLSAWRGIFCVCCLEWYFLLHICSNYA